MKTVKQLIDFLVQKELQKLVESSKEIADNRAGEYVAWLKSLKPTQERPSGWRVGRLKKEKIGKVCAFCAANTMVGVEHIIPRRLGAPKFERWNLAIRVMKPEVPNWDYHHDTIQ